MLCIMVGIDGWSICLEIRRVRFVKFNNTYRRVVFDNFKVIYEE